MCSRECAAEVCVEKLFSSSALAMSGRGRRANSTAKSIIYNLYKYFERENAKSKYRGTPKLTFKTVEATGYSEHTVRRIVAVKSEISGTALLIERRLYWMISTQEALRRLVHDFYHEKVLDSLLVASKDLQYI